MVQWQIQSDQEAREKYTKALGEGEYKRRKGIVEKLIEQFPDDEWQAQMVYGGQFEAIAMQISQKAFDRLAEKDYNHWCNLIAKILA